MLKKKKEQMESLISSKIAASLAMEE